MTNSWHRRLLPYVATIGRRPVAVGAFLHGRQLTVAVLVRYGRTVVVGESFSVDADSPHDISDSLPPDFGLAVAIDDAHSAVVSLPVTGLTDDEVADELEEAKEELTRRHPNLVFANQVPARASERRELTLGFFDSAYVNAAVTTAQLVGPTQRVLIVGKQAVEKCRLYFDLTDDRDLAIPLAVAAALTEWPILYRYVTGESYLPVPDDGCARVAYRRRDAWIRFQVWKLWLRPTLAVAVVVLAFVAVDGYRSMELRSNELQVRPIVDHVQALRKGVRRLTGLADRARRQTMDGIDVAGLFPGISNCVPQNAQLEALSLNVANRSMQLSGTAAEVGAVSALVSCVESRRDRPTVHLDAVGQPRTSSRGRTRSSSNTFALSIRWPK